MNADVVKLALPALLAGLVVGCTPEDKGRIVVAKGYDVPKAWDPVPVMGRTFYTEFAHHHVKLYRQHPELAMFDNVWFQGGFKCPARKILGWDSYRPTNELWQTYPVKMSDIYKHPSNKLLREWQDNFEKWFPGRPFTLGIGGRPPSRLDVSYDTDKADFAQWRKEHPGFYSFAVFDEYDNDTVPLTWQHTVKYKHPELQKRYVEEYGLGHLEYGFARRWMNHDYQKAKAYHFGVDDLSGLWSVQISMAHSMACNGMKLLWYEAEHGSTASPWRWGAAYARGAARQFGAPFGWYTAMFTNNTLCRDGSSAEGKNGVAIWRDGFTYWPNPDYPKTVPHLGASRSLLRRNVRYGYLIGTVLANVECGVRSLYACEGPDGKGWGLSPYGQDFEDMCRWHRNHDRGTVYTPVAMLVSMDESVHRQGYNTFPAKDEASILSFFHTLIPSRTTEKSLYCEPKLGLEGCMWNSEFGEILDVLCPDCGQKPGVFEKILKGYKAAFLVGYLDPKISDTKAIANYIADGGTVFCSYDQVEAGLVSAHDAGVSFGGKTVLAGKKLLNEDGVAVETFNEPYTLHVPSVTNAVPFLKDENGSVVAWAANCGKGRVVTVTARRMMPDKFLELKEDGWRTKQFFHTCYQSVCSGERTFPIVHHLLQRVQKDTMPIDVKGDIQWGLNRTKKGWMLWLINNNGITKFAFEPEDIDLTKTATVTVSLKDLEGMDVSDITDIEKALPVAVKDGKFTVLVRPGEDKRIAIE